MCTECVMALPGVKPITFVRDGDRLRRILQRLFERLEFRRPQLTWEHRNEELAFIVRMCANEEIADGLGDGVGLVEVSDELPHGVNAATVDQRRGRAPLDQSAQVGDVLVAVRCESEIHRCVL